MEIKYEAVFGDQSLFDGAEPDVFLVETNGVYKTFHKETSGKVTIWTRNGCDLAMRRIIRTPTWTVADQKAGKLPEVGCECVYLRNGLIGEIVSIDDSDADDVELCLRFKDKSLLVCKIDRIKPIETPEEKAARLKYEWAKNANELLFKRCSSTTLTEYLRVIYDAMLSGDLPVPVKGE